MKSFNIAIDGPAGAGKSTIAKLTAKRIGFLYVDTGAMYRAIALFMLDHGIDPDNEREVAQAVKNAEITLCYEDGIQQVICNGKNVSGRIRTEQVGNAASTVSAYPTVRDHLLALQRDLAASQNVIMDGRDIGTCILPDADVKIYLTASVRVRARRRCKELTDKGMMCNLEKIEQDIRERDERDKNRVASPLRQAEDALPIDSSELTIDEVIDAIIQIAVSRGLQVP